MPPTGAPTDGSRGSAKSGGRSLYDLMNPPVWRRGRRRRRTYYVSSNIDSRDLLILVARLQKFFLKVGSTGT